MSAARVRIPSERPSLRTPARRAARVALEARPVTDHGELAALAARVAAVALGHRDADGLRPLQECRRTLRRARARRWYDPGRTARRRRRRLSRRNVRMEVRARRVQVCAHGIVLGRRHPDLADLLAEVLGFG